MKIKEAIDTIQRATANCMKGSRHIVVLDRGWIFVGDLSKETDNTYILTDAKNIRKWEKSGFGGLSRGAKTSGATLDDSAPLKFNESAAIFVVPVSEDWENE